MHLTPIGIFAVLALVILVQLVRTDYRRRKKPDARYGSFHDSPRPDGHPLGDHRAFHDRDE